MRYVADLHVHSKHSRATSRDCDLEHLSAWAQKKGITVVATGDFTHPGWARELAEKLVPAEPGLYRLRPELAREVARAVPAACRNETRFLLEVEISTIYKHGERTRKVHHLIYVPDLGEAAALSAGLARIGNLAADGRPILGLDSRDLLELVLTTAPGGFLIPAHIWTPWFSVLGSKSGFDRVEDCYRDLAPHVFAAETGLSSDPPMNWRLSGLDRYRLVSSSDAHSPAKLGREACLFDAELDYFALRRALETGAGYDGTVEFFPEEGKYHLDGHRTCGARLPPEETRARGGLCPGCGKPVTVGVLHRVEALADRPAGVRPAGAPGFVSLVPLAEILGEVLGTGDGSKAVTRAYETLLGRLGPELSILRDVPLDDARRAGGALLAEGLGRLRRGEVRCEAGYDGEYGAVLLFAPGELGAATTGALFAGTGGDDGIGGGGTVARVSAGEADRPAERGDGAAGARKVADGGAAGAPTAPGDGAAGEVGAAPSAAGAPPETPSVVEPAAPGARAALPDPGENASPPPLAAPASAPAGSAPGSSGSSPTGGSRPLPALLAGLDEAQRAAVTAGPGPLLVVAGPGTGKTRVLTHRVAWLVAERAVPPATCLAITFTRRAAAEMRERLRALLGARSVEITIDTLHAFGLEVLRAEARRAGLPSDFRVVDDDERRALLAAATGARPAAAARLAAAVAAYKRSYADPDGELAAPLAAYQGALRAAGAVDFDDLVRVPLGLWSADPELLARYRGRYRWTFVDELQDLDAAQYALLHLLAPAGSNLCGIGDPDQSIYGFRGADARLFERFAADYPDARVIRLERTYRSTAGIAGAALQLIAPRTLVPGRRLDAIERGGRRVAVYAAPTARAEAELVVRGIEELVGGHSFWSLDAGRVDGAATEPYGFGDVAVLSRTREVADEVRAALTRSGMPFASHGHDPLRSVTAARELARALVDTPAEPPLLERLAGACAHLRDEHPDVDTLERLLAPLAVAHGATVARLLDVLATASDADTLPPRTDRISLLTIHAAKGLEFRAVFVVGCEDGVLPLRLGRAPTDLDEERRLLFVAATRARERLILTHARERRRRGRLTRAARSPFLDDVEAALLEETAVAPRAVPVTREPQLRLF